MATAKANKSPAQQAQTPATATQPKKDTPKMATASQSYADLQKHLEELQKEADKTRALLEGKKTEEIKVLVDACAKKLQAAGLDIGEAVEYLATYAPQRRKSRLSQTTGGAPRKERADKGVPPPPKYKGPKGELWSGRGQPPKWMKPELAKGKKKEDFLMTKDQQIEAEISAQLNN
ncbi:H-NS family nucleoid-associated regulatory protein [Variovorax sp. J22R193]|uniref:H-NS family nucleoid-associated regulatory protein n=1 Tax=Variovorax fucosicus TaxID=3053517 RepID=UPI002576ECB8|nr:H-NS family nucleoid-associated regulatory protein [Variovorax sp. J22R193]MDM0042125.1 H-NS family nucleoid-associated regulatory protein [Variovorax sp. J22R193]